MIGKWITKVIGMSSEDEVKENDKILNSEIPLEVDRCFDMDQLWKQDSREYEEKLDKAVSYLLDNGPPNMPPHFNDNDKIDENNIDENDDNLKTEVSDFPKLQSFQEVEYGLELMKAFEPIINNKPTSTIAFSSLFKLVLLILCITMLLLSWSFPKSGIWLKIEHCTMGNPRIDICLQNERKCYGPFFDWIVCDHSIIRDLPRSLKRKLFLGFIRYVTY